MKTSKILIMGKRKENIHYNLKESIDPRFKDIFNKNDLTDNSTNFSSFRPNVSETEKKYSKEGEKCGFQNFIGKKLEEYLDKHIKEVDKPVIEQEFFANKLESIRIFSDADLISEEQSNETQQMPRKKKRKKAKIDKESLKEVAVTYEWIQKQGKILKS